MEKRIISIDISPDVQTEYSENAGVMWEHNATQLQFKIDPSYIGDYRYYIEYRSLLGTKVRTEYLELDTTDNTVTYMIPVTMSSLKGVECYFNIVKIDEDGNTIQVIKPKKFCLTFDFSPDTDNSLAKVNDFSINALMEAIRLGTFKGDKGDKGDKGEIGPKGEQGDGVNNLFEQSVNLYNEQTNTAGKVIDSATGELIDNASYNSTDYILLKAGQYTVTHESDKACFNIIARYNLSKEFILNSRVYVTSGTFEIAEDCYIRLSGIKSRMPNNTIMLVKGTELPAEYMPYYVKLKHENMPVITRDMMADEIISKEKTDFVKISGNLINHMTITEGYVISKEGALTENAEYSITDKLLLKPSTEYTCQCVLRISYFNEDDEHIKSVSFDPTKGTTFTTPSEFVYAIASVPEADVYKRQWQLNEGIQLLPYEKQHLVIDGYRVYDDFDVEIDPISEFENKDRVVFDKSPLFTLDNDVTVYPDTTLTGQAKVDAVYGYYDELMSSNPLYITKTEMGADSQGNMLYRYDFKNPDQKHSTSKYSNAKPKVILVSGIHPELSGIYSLYNTMKEITNNPKIKDLKNDIHFIVVPLVNLYGLVNGSRKNANGVDLARNFEIGWGSYESDTEPTANTYCGTSPMTELECQYVDTILRENTDAICFVSCHSFQSQGTEVKDFIWATVNSKYSANLGEKLVAKLSQEWTDKYDIISTSNGYISENPDNYYIGTSEVSSSGGTEGNQASKYGIHGGTVEVCDYFHFPELESQHLTSFVISRGTEAYLNWILLNVYNYDANF